MIRVLIFLSFIPCLLSLTLPKSWAPTSIRPEFGPSHSLSVEELLEFERNGHLCTRTFLGVRDIEIVKQTVEMAFLACEPDAWCQSARVMLEGVDDDFGIPIIENFDSATECRAALEEYDVELPFLQVFNLWRENPKIEAIVRKFGKTAAQLLGVESVRLYQDSVFYKRVDDGATRWHSDLHMSPLDTNSMVTIWLALDRVPSQENGGTSLTFASGSHRDFALAFHFDPRDESNDLTSRYAETLCDHGELQAGDATWHHGWTLHSSPPNLSESPRLAFTATFFADGARVLSADVNTLDDEDSASYDDWLRDLEPGARAEHRLLPVVYSSLEQ